MPQVNVCVSDPGRVSSPVGMRKDGEGGKKEGRRRYVEEKMGSEGGKGGGG